MKGIDHSPAEKPDAGHQAEEGLSRRNFLFRGGVIGAGALASTVVPTNSAEAGHKEAMSVKEDIQYWQNAFANEWREVLNFNVNNDFALKALDPSSHEVGEASTADIEIIVSNKVLDTVSVPWPFYHNQATRFFPQILAALDKHNLLKKAEIEGSGPNLEGNAATKEKLAGMGYTVVGRAVYHKNELLMVLDKDTKTIYLDLHKDTVVGRVEFEGRGLHILEFGLKKDQVEPRLRRSNMVHVTD